MARARDGFKLHLTKHDVERKKAPRPEEGDAPISGFRLKEYAVSPDAVVKAGKLGDMASQDPLTIKTGGYNDTRNDVNADGKYLLLAVPNFNEGRGDEPMSTYLRLGAACSTWDTALGNELEKVVHLCGPWGKTTLLPFMDDERSRNDCPIHPGVGATLHESKRLHDKGGWRDHSDGNRITTTYGDKIEIIRGSYKMIVLGRQDSPSASAGMDLSGQISQEWGSSFEGASIVVEYTQLYDGTWLLKNSSEFFNQWNRTGGNLKEEYWGELLENYVGQEKVIDYDVANPTWPAQEDPLPRMNPVIIEKTFAKSIDSQTGSAVTPVPVTTETTHVGTSTSSTFADAITESTTCTGTITSSTTASDTSDTTDVSGTASSTTNAGAITDTTSVGAQTSTTTAGTTEDTTIVGAAISTTIAGAAVDTTIVGANVSTFIGTDWSLNVGNAFSLLVGMQESITVALFYLDFKVTQFMNETKLAKLYTSIDICRARGTLMLGPEAVDLKAGNEYDITAMGAFQLTGLALKTSACHLLF
jgi:hypothetical protein